MTPSQFRELEEMEQMNVIFDKGIELAVREDDVHRCHLYKLYNFYVEEIWHKEDKVRFVLKIYLHQLGHAKALFGSIDISILRK